MGEATFFKDVEIAKAFDHPLPVKDPWEVASWGATQPMDFVPGTEFPPGSRPYSNFGYLLLGLVVEKLAGVSYETAVKEKIFAPLETDRPRLSRALREHRAPGEVVYQVSPPVTDTLSVMHEDQRPIAYQYGAENNDNFAGFGGWVMAAVDYARMLAQLQKPENGLLSTPVEQLPVWANEGTVSPAGVTSIYHGAGIPGSQGDAAIRSDGVTFVAIFNDWKSAANASKAFTFDEKPYADHRPMWHDIANGIESGEWPSTDLFPKYRSKKLIGPIRPERELVRRTIPPLRPPDFEAFEFPERRSGAMDRPG